MCNFTQLCHYVSAFLVFLFSISYVFFFVQDAVIKLFQRALQYCDPLKLHFELLGLYERTEQHKLAEELLEKNYLLHNFSHL